MEEIESRYWEVMVNPENIVAARALNPIGERGSLGRSILLFENVDRQQLSGVGDVRRPSVGDLFVTLMRSRAEAPQGA
jgi:ABC-2 type transport system ATP-binding protein